MQLAEQIAGLVREREATASKLSRLDQELASIRRALGLAPLQEQAICEICQHPYTRKRHDQRRCSSCTSARPSRSVDDAKDRDAGATLIHTMCLGAGDDEQLHACSKMVTRLAKNRGPLRCPDCTLAHKRFVTTRSLRKTRQADRDVLARITAAPNRDEGRTAAICTLLEKQGPLATSRVARQLGQERLVVKQALQRLKKAGVLRTVGATNGQKWALARPSSAPPPVEPPPVTTPIGATVVPPPIVAPVPLPPLRTHDLGTVSKAGADTPPAELAKEAFTRARRFGHVLGPFTKSVSQAGSDWIARCQACSTYVTVYRNGEIRGPALRGDCPAITNRPSAPVPSAPAS
jgi:hypothetical protein